ncbi:PIN domain-containing protein [Tropicibacter sp. Alg240-R139]|uniref:PIN domain-containing protein n=1 Tax=Tropicibacter sp. Alg240-R139 TaxID=2305991 RepID=UPI0013E0985D|nr:PIN domain-containing protein [Tropicibacter sp. Alg240-R139]
MLIDTSVWLDMAGSYRAAPLVRALHEMCDDAQLEIIVPDIVREEFARNKDRVATQSTKALQSHVKSLLYALKGHADQDIAKQAQDVLQGLDFLNATQEISIVDQVQELMDHGENINLETSIFHRAKAANRSLYGEAPCHRDKGSIADAILFEVYDEMRQEPVRAHIAFGFATTNHTDFSDPRGDNRTPHPELAHSFGVRSQYILDIAKFVEEADPGALELGDFELGYSPEFRTFTELTEAENLLLRKVWYNRLMNLRYRVEQGITKVVPEADYSRSPNRSDQILDSVWEGALAEGERTRQEVGIENLGPWDDFEWGKLNGKLSALRWVLGDDWDMLDT